MAERKRIYLCLAYMSEEGLEQKYIKETFDTNCVVPLGPNVNGLEEDLKNFVCAGADGEKVADKQVVALSAGTAAVHLALIACGVGSGDEVLVQSFTFCASSPSHHLSRCYARVCRFRERHMEYGSPAPRRSNKRPYCQDG